MLLCPYLALASANVNQGDNRRMSRLRRVSGALALIRDLSAADKPERAWALLCQTLFAANEFIYLR